MSYFINIVQDIWIRLEEALVHKIMAFNTGECKWPRVFGSLGYFLFTRNKFRNRAFPFWPCLGCRKSFIFIRWSKAFIICSYHINSFIFWNSFQIFTPVIWKNMTSALLIEPLQFTMSVDAILCSNQKNAAKNQCLYFSGMSDCISQR